MAIDWNKIRGNLALADPTPSTQTKKSGLDWDVIRERINSQPAAQAPDNGFKINISQEPSKGVPTSSADFLNPTRDLGPGSSISTKAIPPYNETIDKIEQKAADWYEKPGAAQTALKTVFGTLDSASKSIIEAKRAVSSPTATFAQKADAVTKAGLGFAGVAFLPGTVPLAAAADLNTSSGINKYNPAAYTLKYGAKAVNSVFGALGSIGSFVFGKGWDLLPPEYQVISKPTAEELGSFAVMLLGAKAIHSTAKGVGEIGRSVGEIKNVNEVVRSSADVLGMETRTDMLGRVRKPTVEEVNQQYRRAAQEVHPDKGGTTEAFQTVATAKKVLQDYSSMSRKEFAKKWTTPLEAVKRAVSGYLEDGTNQTEIKMVDKMRDLELQDTSAGLTETPSIDPTSSPTYKIEQPSFNSKPANIKQVPGEEVFKFEPPSALPKDFTTMQMRDLVADQFNSPLQIEAKKYATSEEFVNSKINGFHQTNEKIIQFDDRSPAFFNTKKRLATYGRNTISTFIDYKKPYEGDFYISPSEQEKLFPKLKKQGYDAVILRGTPESNEAISTIISLSPSKNTYTEAQLINIWNEVHAVNQEKMAEAQVRLNEYRKSNAEQVLNVPVDGGKSLASVELVPYEDGRFTVKIEADTSGLSLYVPHQKVYMSREAAIEAAKSRILDFANQAVSSAETKSELVQLKAIVDAVRAHSKAATVKEKPAVAKIEMMQNPTTTEEMDLAVKQDRIMNELIHAEKGERIMSYDYDSGERRFMAKRSTFPNWVPSELRSRALFDLVVEHITNGTVPTKAKEIRLYEVVRREMEGQKLAQQFVAENPDVPFFDAAENAAWKSDELTKLYDEARANPENQEQVAGSTPVDETSVSSRADETNGPIQEAQREVAAELERAFDELKQIPRGEPIENPNGIIKAPYEIPNTLLDVIGATSPEISFTRRSLKHLSEKGETGDVLMKSAKEILTRPDEIRQGDLDNRYIFTKQIQETKMSRPYSAVLEVVEKNGNLIVTAFKTDSGYLSGYELLWRTGAPETGEFPPSAYSPEANAGSRPEFSALKEAQNPKANTANIPETAPEVNVKKSNIGKSIEAKAIEQGLTQGFEGTAEYTPVTIKDQARRASELLKSDMDRAKRIIRGEEQLPDGLLAGTLIKAMEDYAMETRDAALALEIANSPLTAETSIHAQEMRMLAERSPDSAVVNIKILKKIKETAAKKSNKTKKSVIDEMEKEVKKTRTKATQETWSSFIDSITCK
ncbi:MAG: DnaJ domain-containing protein [Patescibacteria group bacterium]|nr:DnaJ domain-containing protein [Patescibacteria group bacterium]